VSAEAMAWAKVTSFGSPTRKVVMLVLADYADEHWSCFPGQVRLANETDLSVRSVSRVLADLEAAGWIVREQRRRGDGSRTSDRYTIRRSPRSEQPANLSGSDRQPDTVTGPTCHPAQGSHANVSGHEPPEELPEEPPVENTPAREVTTGNQLALVRDPVAAAPPSARNSEGMDLYWRAFWQAYPRKVGKRAAKQAWDKALRRGADAAVIVAGARRYAADANRDDQYTAHPTTWLNRDGWEDEAEPQRQQRAQALYGAAGTMAAFREVMGNLGATGLAAGAAAVPGARAAINAAAADEERRAAEAWRSAHGWHPGNLAQ
jgi:hypothetical protein